jgi:hypothetical protein
MNSKAALVKRREGRQRQGHQCRLLYIGEILADLPAGSAIDPRVGDGQFPVQQEGILLLQSDEASCVEGIALDVVDALFRLFPYDGACGVAWARKRSRSTRRRSRPWD